MKVTQENFDYDGNDELLLNGKPCDVCDSCKGIGFIEVTGPNWETYTDWCQECFTITPSEEPPEELPESWEIDNALL